MSKPGSPPSPSSPQAPDDQKENLALEVDDSDKASKEARAITAEILKLHKTAAVAQPDGPVKGDDEKLQNGEFV